ncbi:DUF4232 domain-containing protein [Curtobacterium sp. Leaf261]|uniref:DUF4232 domain-containing protein n=1 Tax=Curtobacterium sp. Leaf261 TaxID=1736311 RepID=UPI0006FB904C|nr:DUF4232 domain-containing protein [Curtobacterium sp. Leaf261]KQO63813.1 hypothetical protein ASF23_06315 [Curtobacterium sp. Leaf261]
MAHSKQQVLALVVAGVAILGTLTACAGGGSSDDPTATVTATATKTTTATASPSTGGDSSASPSASSTDAAGGDTGGGTQAGTRCAVEQLRGGTAAGGGGAAGSVEITLTFTNTGSTDCTLQGWPGVSFVGGGNGTQIGSPATLDRSAAHDAQTLAPGGVVSVPLKIVQAGNFSNAECSPRDADGFRVYPPGSKTAMFIAATGYVACNDTSVSLLSVGAVTAG